jgi:hypothetical protein
MITEWPNDDSQRLGVISRTEIRNFESNEHFKPLLERFAKQLFEEDGPTPAGDALLIELGRTAFEMREGQDGATIITDCSLQSLRMDGCPTAGFVALRGRIQCTSKEYTGIGTQGDRLHRYDRGRMQRRLDELHESSQYCSTLGLWG